MNPRLLPLVIWVAGLAGFMVMAAFAYSNWYFPGDLWVTHHLQKIHSSAFNDFVKIPETLVSDPYAEIIWVAALAALWFTHHRWEAILLLFIAPTGWVLVRIAKIAVDRPRPATPLIAIAGAATEGHSFPSGHEMSAFMVFGSSLYIAGVLVGPLLLRLALQLLCLYGVVFTGVARIYHGDHWLSDIYGSALLGTLVLACYIAFDRAVAFRPSRVAARNPTPYLGRQT